jgi:hypothetical protein
MRLTPKMGVLKWGDAGVGTMRSCAKPAKGVADAGRLPLFEPWKA